MCDKMSEACEKILFITEQLYTMQDFIPTLLVDTVLDMTKINTHFMQQIESLRPFGMGFQSPLFMIENVSSIVSPLGQTGQHLKWETGIRGLEMVGFHIGDFAEILSSVPMHLIGKITTRTWRDVVTIQFQVVDAVKV